MNPLTYKRPIDKDCYLGLISLAVSDKEAFRLRRKSSRRLTEPYSPSFNSIQSREGLRIESLLITSPVSEPIESPLALNKLEQERKQRDMREKNIVTMKVITKPVSGKAGSSPKQKLEKLEIRSLFENFRPKIGEAVISKPEPEEKQTKHPRNSKNEAIVKYLSVKDSYIAPRAKNIYVNQIGLADVSNQISLNKFVQAKREAEARRDLTEFLKDLVISRQKQNTLPITMNESSKVAKRKSMIRKSVCLEQKTEPSLRIPDPKQYENCIQILKEKPKEVFKFKAIKRQKTENSLAVKESPLDIFNIQYIRSNSD